MMAQLYSKVFEGTFESVTPWWGGGPYGTVMNTDGKVWYPTAETIVGKTKWFTRQLMYFCKGFNLSGSFDHLELEKYVKDLFGYDGMNPTDPSIFRVIVEPLASNVALDDSVANALKSIMRVNLELSNYGFLSVRDLPVMDMKFNIRIEAPPDILLGKPKGAKKLAAAMMLTLAYAGIGRASNRGFGRFYPTSILSDDETLSEIFSAIKAGDCLTAFRTGLDYIFGGCGNALNNFLNDRIDVISCTKSLIDLMRCIGDAFMTKSYPGKRPEDLAVFGLPRDRLKGWLPFKNKFIERVQSPVIAGPIVDVTKSSGCSILLIRLYYDHLNDISVFNKTAGSLPLNAAQLNNTSGTMYWLLKDFLRKNC
ncbi:MAG: hypothetical protein ACP5LW_06260 [Nitrososphaeria archaeon]